MVDKPVKVCILGAAFTTDNMGVSVLAAGAIRCVLHSYPEAQIFQMDYAREGSEFDFSFNGRRVPIRLVNLRFSKKIFLTNNIAILILLALFLRLIPFEGLRRKLASSNTYLNELIEADIVVSLAGGDSFSDIYGLSRLLYMSLPQFLAIFAGKRLILLPQTIGPFQRGVSMAIARFILKHAEMIYSRDRQDVNSIRGMLGQGVDETKVRFCYDVGFDVDPTPPSQIDLAGLRSVRNGDSPVVGFNISGLLMMGGYSQKNMFGLKAEYRSLTLRMIRYFLEHRAATVVLIPHVFGSMAESDVPACAQVFELLKSDYEGRIHFVRDPQGYGEVKSLIGMCDFFVGARMHACIGALSQSIPALSIAYSNKFIGVMDSIGVGDLVLDPRRMDENQILQVTDLMFDQRLRVRHALEREMPTVKQTIRSLLREQGASGGFVAEYARIQEETQ